MRNKHSYLAQQCEEKGNQAPYHSTIHFTIISGLTSSSSSDSSANAGVMVVGSAVRPARLGSGALNFSAAAICACWDKSSICSRRKELTQLLIRCVLASLYGLSVRRKEGQSSCACLKTHSSPGIKSKVGGREKRRASLDLKIGSSTFNQIQKGP